MRDGLDSGYFIQVAILQRTRIAGGSGSTCRRRSKPGTRFKYSNHGYGLLGQVIASVAGEPYNDWIRREIVQGVGLTETAPDMPIDRSAPLASGHTGEYPLGRRAVILRGKMLAHALSSATGRFERRRISPSSSISCRRPRSRSILSAESRREMTRRHWRNPEPSLEGYYGLGIDQRQRSTAGPGSAIPAPCRATSPARRRWSNPTCYGFDPDECHRRLGRLLDGQPGSASSAHSSAAERLRRQVRDWTGRWREHVARDRSGADGKQGGPGYALRRYSPSPTPASCAWSKRDLAQDQPRRWFWKFRRAGPPCPQARQGPRSRDRFRKSALARGRSSATRSNRATGWRGQIEERASASQPSQS